ncbi:MAG: hypothetical protein ABSF50_06880 [Burkholderiaceae bacterium]|jgi:hypothetical protein
MNPIICAAIRGRNHLAFSYGGLRCIIEPYAYGKDLGGHDLLRAYWTGPSGASQEPRDWGLFDLSKIRSLALLNTQFAPRLASYVRDDPALDALIYCQI